MLYAAVGVHPSNVQELTERDYEWLEEKLAAPKAVAVGEIGLDYYWDKEPEVQARQRESFSRQLQLAKKLDKPVIIHSRDAAKDTLDVMAAEGGSQLRAVIHCFSYTKETAREFQKWDYYFAPDRMVLSLQSFCWEKGMRYTALPAVLLWQTLEESTICWRNMQ